MPDIRDEGPGDTDAITELVTAAFREAEHSSGTEAAIVAALRNAGALTVSLVAVEAGDIPNPEILAPEILGHVAFSPVTIDGLSSGWFGLGPIAVHPRAQHRGIGAALIQAGLRRLQDRRAQGCVVLGDPAYYGRFGFVSDPALRYADVPPEYFQRLVFRGPAPVGKVAYHDGFNAV